MEITNEIKTKVIAQYLGQNVAIPENYQFSGLRTDATIGELTGVQDCFIKINGISGFYPYEHFKIILKPLSSISDEDAIDGYYMSRAGICLADRETIAKWNPEAGIKTLVPNGKRVIEKYLMEDVKVYQFLQSKGYDLPNYLLDGKTLKESGLSIYEN